MSFYFIQGKDTKKTTDNWFIHQDNAYTVVLLTSLTETFYKHSVLYNTFA